MSSPLNGLAAPARGQTLAPPRGAAISATQAYAHGRPDQPYGTAAMSTDSVSAPNPRGGSQRTPAARAAAAAQQAGAHRLSHFTDQA